MDKVAFKNSEVIQILNQNYYAIKMDAESTKTIFFEGQKYSNNQLGKSRRPKHQIPLLLASRKNRSFSLPASIILDKNFKIEKRYYEYLSPKKMIKMIN